MSAVGLAAAAFVLAACGSSSSGGGAGASGGSAQPTGPITVAAFNFGESKILANMYADVLKKAGFDASVKPLGAREIVEPALEKGSANGGVDVVPEYLATFTEFLNTKENGTNAPPKATPDVNATLAAAKDLAGKVGITVLTPSTAADENAFATTKDFATKNNLTTLSDLANYKGPLILGGPPECPKRPFCEPGLQQTYGIHFTGFTSLDAGGPLTKKALTQGKIQVGLVFSSDGGIDALGLKVLQDDKHLQNPDVIVATVNSKSVSDKLTAALNSVAAALTTDDLIALNKKVDIDGGDPAQVAQEWLASKGLA
jgi:osmoprotectant transport system substrate-binding protein